ncbi:lysosomal beta glucosidase [Glycine max]|uniref:Glycoside hydrolase family 3 N-terminal domain-containing protein n=1 Tax=Glycine max TaxID=3847 RepID=A0A0R0G057_SOYBN|nr:lysosomal beta glucosidase [Glycine max]
MSRALVHLLGVLWLCCWLASTGESQIEYLRYKDPKQPVPTRVRDLMSRMTLEEKIGQMVQIDRSVANANVMKTSFIGSVLSGGGSEPLPRATAEDWVNMINDFQKGALESRLGIPMIYGIDAVHGHNNVYNATIFPHNVGLGCTRQGFVISDWQGIDRLTSPPSSNYTYSVQASIEAGVDMVMVPFEYGKFIQDLTLLVKSNIIPMERIDDAVERILLVKFTMGLFENPLADTSLVNELGSQEHRDLAREAVRKSLVLLKNGKNESASLLPLPKKVPKILVAGSHADNLGYQCGGWTIKWQGFSGNSDTRGTTILNAIKSAVDTSTEVVFRDNPDNEFVKSNNFEYAIVVVGEPPYAETAGDSTTLTMMESGPNVINNVCGTVKCVVVIISGRPIVIEPYISSIDALVAAWLPGTEGQGMTDVLFGDYGFTGKLARTWFKSVDQLPMNVGDPHYDPLFPFGFGLTTESVKDLVARSTSAAVGARACIFTIIVTLIISLYLPG